MVSFETLAMGGYNEASLQNYRNCLIVHPVSSRIQPCGWLAVAYPGFQRGSYLRSGPIRKVGGVGGQSTSGPIYGGGTVHFRSDTFVWHTENTLSLIIKGYNFDQGGSSSTSHARANKLYCCF